MNAESITTWLCTVGVLSDEDKLPPAQSARSTAEPEDDSPKTGPIVLPQQVNSST